MALFGQKMGPQRVKILKFGDFRLGQPTSGAVAGAFWARLAAGPKPLK
jgi:hypothetical protein